MPVPPAVLAAPRAPAADPATGVTTELDGVAPIYDQAVMAELAGDVPAARDGYEKLLAAQDAPAGLAARSALRLAQLEARAGKNRHALDLGARAAALAPNDVAITDGIAQLRADLVAATGAGDIHPPIGTPLPGVDAKVADAFAAAEHAFAAVHARHARPVIEALSASIRAQEDAFEAVAARYHAIAESPGLAHIAASYREGSVYHDLGLGLLFEPLPPELDSTFAAGLHRVLRTRALANLKKAIASYESCLAGPAPPDAELWRLAAETDLRAARDVLGKAGE